MDEDVIMNTEANQLCVGGATAATAPRVSSDTSAKQLLGTCPSRMKSIESSPRLLLGSFLIIALSSILNRQFHNISGFSHLLRITALMASLAAFGRTFEANRFA